MTAQYRIDQNGDLGDPGVARRDLALTLPITLHTMDVHTTYLWEVISYPEGPVHVLTASTARDATLVLNTTGGYLVRLTVDADIPTTKDVSILYLGVPLPNSQLCIPAHNETFYDNSQQDDFSGYERKLSAFFKWMDTAAGQTSGTTVKVNPADAAPGYLKGKLMSNDASVSISEVDVGGGVYKVNLTALGGVTAVSGTAPIVSSGGSTPAISITAATTLAAGSMSADDKIKLDGAEITGHKGQMNGYASLDANAKVPLTQIPDSLIGSVIYKGSWNAATNIPALASGVGTKGYYYVVGTEGTTSLDGITDWMPGDWAIFNGTVWEKVDNTSDIGETYDVVTNTGVLSTAEELIAQLSTGTITTGNVQAVVATVVAGASDNLDIWLYNGNPATTGVRIYEVLGVNRTDAALDDRNVVWISFASGQLYLRVKNNAATDVTMDIRVRIADTGADYFRGDIGPQGIQGEQGIQGIQGEQGIQGIQGEKGDKGDEGLTSSWWSSFSHATIVSPSTIANEFTPTADGKATWHFSLIKGGVMTEYTVEAIWDYSAGTVSYRQAKGVDLGGSTSDVSFSVVMSGAAGSVRLLATAASDNWTVDGIRYATGLLYAPTSLIDASAIAGNKGKLRRKDTGMWEAVQNGVVYYSPDQSASGLFASAAILRKYVAAGTSSGTVLVVNAEALVATNVVSSGGAYSRAGGSGQPSTTDYADIRWDNSSGDIEVFLAGTGYSILTGTWVDYVETPA